MDEINPKTVNIYKTSTIDPDIKSKILQQKDYGSFDKILTKY